MLVVPLIWSQQMLDIVVPAVAAMAGQMLVVP
jgi:hypothetical protein